MFLNVVGEGDQGLHGCVGIGKALGRNHDSRYVVAGMIRCERGEFVGSHLGLWGLRTNRRGIEESERDGRGDGSYGDGSKKQLSSEGEFVSGLMRHDLQNPFLEI